MRVIIFPTKNWTVENKKGEEQCSSPFIAVTKALAGFRLLDD